MVIGRSTCEHASPVSSAPRRRNWLARFALSCCCFILPVSTAAGLLLRADDEPHHVLRARAVEHLGWDRYAEAAEVYARLLQRGGEGPELRDEYAFSLLRLGRAAEAAAQWERALALGADPRTTHFNLACARTALTQIDTAINHLHLAFEAGFLGEEYALLNDPTLEALRAHPRFASIVGVPPADLSRADGWRFDLAWLARRLRQVHPLGATLFPRLGLRQDFERLAAEAPGLGDRRMILEVQRHLARLEDAHTLMMIPWAGPAAFRRLPVEFTFAGDELLVTAAPTMHEALLGGSVMMIGGRPREELAPLLEAFIADESEAYRRLMLGSHLGVLEFLEAAGVKAVDETVSLTVRSAGGEVIEASLRLRLRDDRDDLWPLHPPRPEAAPAWRDPDSHYWFDWSDDRQLGWLRINRARHEMGNQMARFLEPVLATLEAHPSARLVIDLRHCGAGDSAVLDPLRRFLVGDPRWQRVNRLYVVIGPRTFGPGVELAAALEHETSALLVGEATGGRPRSTARPVLLTLPWSGLRVSCPTAIVAPGAPDDTRRGLFPALPALMTGAHLRAGRDPAWEAIIALLDDDDANEPE